MANYKKTTILIIDGMFGSGDLHVRLKDSKICDFFSCFFYTYETSHIHSLKSEVSLLQKEINQLALSNKKFLILAFSFGAVLASYCVFPSNAYIVLFAPSIPDPKDRFLDFVKENPKNKNLLFFDHGGDVEIIQKSFAYDLDKINYFNFSSFKNNPLLVIFHTNGVNKKKEQEFFNSFPGKSKEMFRCTSKHILDKENLFKITPKLLRWFDQFK